MTGPLVGTRVLDATRALSGPFATMLLADIGADVVKVEMPGVGDDTRYWGPPFIDDAGATFIGFNRNKRSVAIDLHTEDGRSTFLALARTADIVVENFRPGTMRRFGLDYESLRQVKSDVIYCSISGYGQSGPFASRPAMDLLVQAVSGIMSITGESEGRPVKAAAPVADIMAGFSAAFAILAAIHERHRTGQGRFIDISMLDGMLTLLGQSIVAHSITGQAPRRLGNGHALMAPYQSYRTADREIVIAVTNEKTWDALCRVPDFAHLKPRSEFAEQADRNRNRATLNAEIERIFESKPAAHWLAHFESEGIPAEPVNTLPEIAAHQHVRERGSLMEVAYPAGSGRRVTIPGMPWRDVAAARPQLDPPSLGQHTDEILAEIGDA